MTTPTATGLYRRAWRALRRTGNGRLHRGPVRPERIHDERKVQDSSTIQARHHHGMTPSLHAGDFLERVPKAAPGAAANVIEIGIFGAEPGKNGCASKSSRLDMDATDHIRLSEVVIGPGVAQGMRWKPRTAGLPYLGWISFLSRGVDTETGAGAARRLRRASWFSPR